MKKSFVDDETGTPVNEPDPTVLGDIEGGGGGGGDVDVYRAPLGLGEMAGDIDESDLKVPQLKVAHGVGALSVDFAPGDLVINEKYLIAKRDEPINATVLGIRKFYEENLPYDEHGPRPQVFDSRAQVVAAGFWTEWRDGQPPPINEVADVTLLVEKPEGVTATCFSTEYEGKTYCRVRFIVRRGAYATVAKAIFTARAVELAGKGLLFGNWTLHTELQKKKSGKMVNTPVASVSGIHDEKFVEFLKKTFG